MAKQYKNNALKCVSQNWIDAEQNKVKAFNFNDVTSECKA